MTLEQAIAVIGFLIGLGTTLVGVLSWYSSSVKKKYAAEREFKHLQNNQEQLKLGITQMCNDMDEGFAQINVQLIELKAYLIRYSGESTTGGKL